MRNKLLFLVLAAAVVGLSACGGSSGGGSDEFPDAYLQFYNGSPNSAQTSMREKDSAVTLGSASYGDATGLIARESGDRDIEFFRTDSDDQKVVLKEVKYNLSSGEKTLVVLSGNFDNPTFNEHKFKREELSGHFRLFALGLVEGDSYDLHMSTAGAPFSAANRLGTISYQNFEELKYWAGDSDSDDFDRGEYTIYLTAQGGTEVLLETPTVNFNFATEYVLAVRKSSGAIQNSLEVDLITNSSQVLNYSDVDASSQYRLYNSLDNDTLTVDLDGNNNVNQNVELAPNTLSAFKEIKFGDYRLSAKNADDSKSFNNLLTTLNQGQSKAIVLYEDKDGKLTSLSFQESNQPQQYDKRVLVANLVPDFTDVDFYFVRKDETIQTAKHQISSIDFGESKALTLPSDFYELIAVFDNNNDTQTLLDRTALLGINENANYIITIEKSESSATGYKISLLK